MYPRRHERLREISISPWSSADGPPPHASDEKRTTVRRRAIEAGRAVKDGLVVILLSASLAMAVTAHLAIVYGLLHRAPRWRAPLTLVLPFLGPWFANREGMHVRASVLVVGVVGYVALRLLSTE